MFLIFSTGSNLGNRVQNLHEAKAELCKEYKLSEESQIYESPAVDYLNQPDFLNQVLLFEEPSDKTPQQVLEHILSIESSLGRVRNIDKGPRTVDIDLLFWGTKRIQDNNLEVPHPRLFVRSFVVEPLRELSVFPLISSSFLFPEKFDNHCWVFKP